MRGLYAIVDLGALDARGLDPVAFGRAAVRGGARALQLRAKRVDGSRFFDVLRSLAGVAADGGAVLYANDRADVALLASCAGVHVGQRDLPPRDVKALARSAGRELAVGLSTHDEAQADLAVCEPVDYVAVGPVFATSSKENPDATLGVRRARAIAERIKSARAGVPVVAIGGVTPVSARQLVFAFDAVAVISDLLPGPGEGVAAVERRAASFAEVFEVAR